MTLFATMRVVRQPGQLLIAMVLARAVPAPPFFDCVQLALHF